MALAQMHRGDEDPPWVATVTVNDEALNYSSGYTFTVLITDGGVTPFLTKTTGIAGAAGGVVTTSWAVDDFDIAPGTYAVLLTIRRTSDGREHTVEDSVEVVARG